MPNERGHRKLLEQLHTDGITYLFGNPGSSEEGLLDEISRFPDIRYILGLQEAAIVSVADGYAQATQKPAVVQLHTGVGLGSALGGLYHALRRKTPMLVIAGEAGVAYDALEAHMAVDLVAMARPVTKYATRVLHPGSLLRLVRRCLKIAATPPWGPVFLAVPQDVLDAPNDDEQVLPTIVPDTRVMPDPTLIARTTEILATAERPIILVGDGVSHAKAQTELTRFAEVLGAGVWGAMASELIMPWTHPLYCGLTGHMFGQASARIVEDADVVVVAGTYVFPDVFPLLTNPFRPDAKVVHIDLDAYAIAKNHPITIGLVSDPQLTLRCLAESLANRMTDAQMRSARARVERIGADNARARDQAMQQDRAAASVPLRMSAFAEVLAQRLPEDSIVFDESLTHSPELMRWLPPSAPGSFFQTPGGTLGVGLPGAVGAKLAHPARTVIGFTGDGGAMYTYQALWTAAHYGVGAKFVVCNNYSYRLLKMNLLDYWRQQGLSPDQYPSFPPPFDIGEPHLDFVGLAQALGVPGKRVAQPSEIAPALETLLAMDGPFLVELVLEGDVPTPAEAAAASDRTPVTAQCPVS